jgi:hypothetical protein
LAERAFLFGSEELELLEIATCGVFASGEAAADEGSIGLFDIEAIAGKLQR